MGNTVSNNSSQVESSGNISDIRKKSRLSLRKSLLSQTQNFADSGSVKVEPLTVLSTQPERYTSVSMSPEMKPIVNTRTSDFRTSPLRKSTDCTVSISTATSQDTKLRMSDIFTISESESDVNTSTDDCIIIATQTNAPGNDQRRSSKASDTNVLSTSTNCDMEVQLETTTCNSSPHFLSDESSDSIYLSSDSPKKTHSDSQSVSQELGRRNVTRLKPCKLTQKNNDFIKAGVTKPNSYLDHSIVECPLLCNSDSDDPSVDIKSQNEKENTTHSDGKNSLSTLNNGNMAGSWDNITQDVKGSNNVESHLTRSDTIILSKSLFKNVKSNMSAIAKFINAKVSSQQKKQNLVNEAIMISSDEETDELHGKQQVDTCHQKELDSDNQISMMNRNPSVSWSQSRSSTMEYNTEANQSLKGKCREVANSLESSTSSLSKIQNTFPALTSNNSSSSLSQEIPYQGEKVYQRADKTQDNPDPPEAIHVATSSHTSISSMPSLQQKPSSFYENELCDDNSPPLLSQHLITSTPVSSEKQSSFGLSSPINSITNIKVSSSVSADKKCNLSASEHLTAAEVDMFTENSAPCSEHSEDNVHSKIIDILEMLDSEDEPVNILPDRFEKTLQEFSGKESKSGKELAHSTHKDEQGSFGALPLNVSVTFTGVEGSDLAVVKKEKDDNAFTSTGNVYMYTEINDEIYLLDSDDDDFFMSQSIQGTQCAHKEESEQQLDAVQERSPQIDEEDNHVMAESECSDRPAFSQLNKNVETSLNDKPSFRKFDSIEDFEADNENWSDYDDLDMEAAPLGSLLQYRWASNSKHSSKENTDGTASDFYISRNIKDNTGMKSDPSGLDTFTDDHAAGSTFNDDDDYFLSQMDDVNDPYFAHTQVDYVAHSDGEFEHLEDGVKCKDVNDAVKNSRGEDSMHVTLANIDKDKQLVLDQSKDLENIALPLASFEDGNNQDPFCLETQEYSPSATEEQGQYDVKTLPVSTSLDGITHGPTDADVHRNFEIKTKQDPNEKETLEVSSDDDWESLFSMATHVSQQPKTDCRDLCERQSPAVSSLLKQDTHSSAGTKLHTNSQLAVKDQEPFEKITVAGSSDGNKESLYNMATQKTILSETDNIYNRETLVASPFSSEYSEYFFMASTQKSYQSETKDADSFGRITVADSPNRDKGSQYNIATQKNMPSGTEDNNPYDRETLAVSPTSSEDSECFFSVATQKSSQSETENKNVLDEKKLTVSAGLNDDTQDPSDAEDNSWASLEEKDVFENMTIADSPNGDKDSLYNIATQNIVLSEIQIQDPYNRQTLAISPCPSEDSERLFTVATQKSNQSGPTDKNMFDREKLAVTLPLNEDTQDSSDIEDFSQATLEEKDPFKKVADSPNGERFYNMETQKIVLLETDVHDPYNRETLAVSPSRSEDSDSFYEIATQKSCHSETKDRNMFDSITHAVSLSFNENIQDTSIAADNSRAMLEEDDLFDKETVADSPNTDMDRLYNMATQKIVLSEIQDKKSCDREILTVSAPINEDTQDPYDTENNSQSALEKNLFEEMAVSAPLNGGKDILLNRTADHTILMSETRDHIPYDKDTLAVSVSLNEDTQDPYDIEEHSQTLEEKDKFERMTASDSPDDESLYNMATQIIVLSETEVQDPYYKETLAVSPCQSKGSEFLSTNKMQQKYSAKKSLSLVEEEITEDTQDPFGMDTAFSSLQEQAPRHNETSADLPSLSRHVDNHLYIQTQKEISPLRDTHLGKKEMVAVSVPQMEGEDSDGLFSIKDLCSPSTDQDPYDVETLAMSSLLKEDLQGPFSIETQIDSPAGAKYGGPYDRETLAASSFSEDYMDPYSIETDVDGSSFEDTFAEYEEVLAVTPCLSKDKEDPYLIQTQREMQHVPDLRPCDKETEVVSLRGDKDSSEGHLHSDIGSQDDFLLPTQVDFPQSSKDQTFKNGKSLALSSIQISHVQSTMEVPNTVQSMREDCAPFVIVESPLCSKYNPHHMILQNSLIDKDYPAHQPNQNAKHVENKDLKANQLQSIKKNGSLLKTAGNELSANDSQKVHLSNADVKGGHNSITHIFQSPNCMKSLIDCSFIKGVPDSNVTEAITCELPSRHTLEPLRKQVQNGLLSVTDDIKPSTTFLPSAHLHREDKCAENIKTSAEPSHDFEVLKKYTPPILPSDYKLSHPLNTSSLLHAQNNGTSLEAAFRFKHINDRQTSLRHGENNVLSYMEENLIIPDVKDLSGRIAAVTSNITQQRTIEKCLVQKHPDGETVHSHKTHLASHAPPDKFHSFTTSFKRPAVQNNEVSAKKKCIGETTGHSTEHTKKTAALKRRIENIGMQVNNKSPKRMKGKSSESFSGSSWLSVNKGETADGKQYKFSSIIKNVSSKPRRPRKKSTTTTKVLTSQVEIAKQTLQERLMGSRSAKPVNVQIAKSSASNMQDENEDVEMPSTQDMMNLGLPILSAKLPISKRHLARGLPSQGRLASEENYQQSKNVQSSNKRVPNQGASVTMKKDIGREGTVSPVPLFNLPAPNNSILSQAANPTWPVTPVIGLENIAASTAHTSGSTGPFLGLSHVSTKYHKISESEPNKLISQTQTSDRLSVSHQRSPAGPAVEYVQTAVSKSTNSVVSVDCSDLRHSTPTPQPDRINLPGPISLTLPAHSKTATDTLPRGKGILKSNPALILHQSGSKTVSKVNFSDSHLPDFSQLRESAKSKPESKLLFLSTILKWNPIWLKEREVNQSLPELFGKQNKIAEVCSRLRMSYSTFHEYVDITLNLLVLECWETIFRDWKMSKSQPSVNMEVHCVCNPCHPYKSNEGRSLIYIEVTGLVTQQNRRNIPLVGDFLIIDLWGARKIGNKYEKPRWYQQFAFVKSAGVQKTNIKQFLQTNKIFESSSALRDRYPVLVNMKLILQHKGFIITPSKLHKIEAISSLKIIERQIDALINLPENPLCVHLLNPRSAVVFTHQAIQPNPHLCAKLNKEQATAVETILREVTESASSQKVFLLQGPPGTGKSHTILALIHQILVKTNFTARICLATPSNAAVDEIAKRIINFSHQLKQKGLKAISLVRVGNKNRVQKIVSQFMWENLVDQILIEDVPESLKRELRLLERQKLELEQAMSDPSLTEDQNVMKNNLKREVETNIVRLQKEMAPRKSNCRETYKAKCRVLDGAHVICGTLNSFGSVELKEIVLRKEEHRHRKIPFTCLIIDEATQAIEVDCLIPLQHMMSKVVLIGDHKQLPATVLSQMASEKCLARSLFERLGLWFSEFRERSTPPVMMLTRQYRMHNDILSLPNSFFYDRELVTDESVLARTEVIAPYLVFDIQASRETRDKNNRSVSNEDEAMCTAQLCGIVKQMIKQIGVICPYADQQQAIFRCLKQRNLEVDIEVNTVDSFQGQEREVIILSCVRAQSNPSGIGFLADRKRMNVALTRARQALYIIGHFDTLCTDELWAQLYKNALERKLLVKVTKTADFDRHAESAIFRRGHTNTATTSG